MLIIDVLSTVFNIENEELKPSAGVFCSKKIRTVLNAMFCDEFMDIVQVRACLLHVLKSGFVQTALLTQQNCSWIYVGTLKTSLLFRF